MMSDHLAAQAAENLRRWKDSGQPRRWVDARQGQWDHAAWEQLLAGLRASEFWPLEPGDARQWVEDHEGQWGSAEWQQLVETLRQSGFWPIQLSGVGRLLEELKLAYWNLRRWRDSGLARRWVQANGGRWDHAARLAL